MNHLLRICSLTFLLCACSTETNQPTDTSTTGEITITVDESFKKLLDVESSTFQSLYPNSKINVNYLPESDALFQLTIDSSKVAVIGRDITPSEKKMFASKNLFPISTKVAEDAIAVITHPQNNLNELTIEALTSILSGKYYQKMNVVFDNTKSANALYIKDSLMSGKMFSNNVFALNSNLEVIDYVSKNKNTIGFLSVNWISDQDDKNTTEILKKVIVVAIAKNAVSKAFKPFQAYIKTKEYPFTRNIFMINRQTRSGLAKGFVNFVAGEKGQLIILKSGLIPAFPPQRIIQITNKN